jgi:N-glycosylase/DNA lyase
VNNPSRPPGARRLSVARDRLDLATSLRCGQVFHWENHGEGWIGALGDDPVYLEQVDDALWIAGAPDERVESYLALDHPLEEIVASFPQDDAMRGAAQFSRGMRIFRQPEWECLASFITSAMKQVAHITQMSLALRRSFGQPLVLGGRTLHAYPTPAAMAAASEAQLRACGLGFRAANLLRTARMIDSGEVSLEAVAAMGDDEAREELCRLPGVGVKVANCALLFGFGRLAAFPIDVWIERILRTLYFKGKRRVTPRRLREFAATYFGAYGGYAQQYLFHHARQTWGRGERGKKG